MYEGGASEGMEHPGDIEDPDRRKVALDEIEQLIEELEAGERDVDYADLFPPELMQDCSRASSFEEFVADSPFDADSVDDIPEDEWDQYVRRNTTHTGWAEMKRKGQSEWARRTWAAKH